MCCRVSGPDSIVPNCLWRNLVLVHTLLLWGLHEVAFAPKTMKLASSMVPFGGFSALPTAVGSQDRRVRLKKKPAYQTLHSDILKKQSLLLGAAVLECFWFNTVSVAPNRFRRNLILGHHLLWSLLSVASNRFRRNLILGHHLLWSLLSVASNRFRRNLILGHHLLLWSLLSVASNRFRLNLILGHHLLLWSLL